MSVEITMPKLGLTMAEGTIIEWHCSVGDKINKGDILFVLETEKVTYEVESPEDGILADILVHVNETVPVGTVVAYLAHQKDEIEVISKKNMEKYAQKEVMITSPQKTETILERGFKEKRAKATPLAKKKARIYNLELHSITGSGLNGRIFGEDVEAAHQNKYTSTSDIKVHPAESQRLVPFSGMRRAIAKKMLASKLETAQTYMSISVDATDIMMLRQSLLKIIEGRYKVRLTITDILMKITASAIKDHPIINSRVTDKGILYLDDIHMGMAMALSEGLIVPVIRNINRKSFGQIAYERTEIMRKGKENRLLPDEITGSTFTLSSMGMFGIEQFTSNINLPENAILAVGVIVDKPVAINNQVVIRPIMTVTLSYDHRAIDGAEAGKFMRTLKHYIEKPNITFA